MIAKESARSEERPKVSVCVVTYNQRDYIAECLESIVTQQTDFPFEVIVGDDASTDGTTDIVRDYAARYPHLIRPMLHEKNLGPFENYRVVHRAARGEYVAHIDGDDYWLPGKLAVQAEFLDASKDCAAVYGNAYVIDKSGKRVGVFNNRQPEKFDLMYLLSGKNFLNHSSMMYRNVGKNFIPDDEFIDLGVYVNIGVVGDFGYINSIYSVYRIFSIGSIIEKSRKKIEDIYLETIISNRVRCLFGVRQLKRFRLIFESNLLYNAIVRLNFSDAANILYRKKLSASIFMTLSVSRIILSKLISRIISEEKIYNYR